MDEKVTPKQMLKFKLEYDSIPGLINPQRFGQAFCNEFNITNPELFYIENRRDAEEYIWLFHVT